MVSTLAPPVATSAASHRGPVRVDDRASVPGSDRVAATASTGHEGHRRTRGITWVAAASVALGVVGWFGWVNRTAINPAGWLAQLHWGWAVLALVASAGTLAGNALNLMGSAPVRLRFGRTMAVQSTGTVARLVSPASVGGSAINVVYLRRLGVRAPVALTAVGISHAVQFVSTTLMLLAAMAWMGNAPAAAGLPSSRHTLLGLAGFGLLAAAAAIVVRRSPRLRHRLLELARELRGSVAQLLRQPRRAVLGFGGAIMISVAMTVSLWASAHAFGAHVGLASALLMMLLGSTAGGLIPVPGGIGAVDACLVATMVAAGAGLAVAVPIVALFRLATLWLHLPVGMVTGAVLRRRGWL